MRKFPDTLVIVFLIMLVFWGLTFIIPSGEFETTEKAGRQILVPDSYHKVEDRSVSFLDFMQSPLKGFVSAADIIAFIFLAGGAFSILNKTGAINAGLNSLLLWGAGNQKKNLLIIPVIMTAFSLAGATFGMSEETLVFIMITIPLAKTMGYDNFVGVSMAFVAAGAGFAGAFLNPFTIGIAQAVADLPPFSGMFYRVVVWVIFTIITIVYVMRYASKNKAQIETGKVEIEDKLSGRQKLILIALFLTLAIIIYGVNVWGWYISEIAAVFFLLGIVALLIGKMKLSEGVAAFGEGAQSMITAALVIAFSKGILILATEGRIIDTMLFGLSRGLDQVPTFVSVQLMFVVQSVINIFIPSGSGQAALSMPIMAPLSDILGVTRQTAVLSFQFGDGISNLIIPTSGVTMGVLSIANIPYDKWVGFIWKLIVILSVTAMLLLIPPVLLFEYGPF